MGSSTGQRTAIAQTLITIERFMREHGLDYQRAARAVGIDPAVARVPDARVPLRNLAQLLENVARETDNDAFGAQVGASFRPGTTGTLDYVISNAPTLRVALNDYVRFLALVSDHLDPRLEEGPWMSYMVTPLPASFGPSAQLMDAQTAVRIARIRHIMRDPSFPLQVELKRAKPRALGEFRRIFGQRVRFEQAENRIGIATRALDKELPAADPQLYRVLVQAAKTALSERLVAAHPISRVTSYIGAGLAHGKVSLAAAARAATPAFPIRHDFPRACPRDPEGHGGALHQGDGASADGDRLSARLFRAQRLLACGQAVVRADAAGAAQAGAATEPEAVLTSRCPPPWPARRPTPSAPAPPR
jgi:hypothetical protein